MLKIDITGQKFNKLFVVEFLRMKGSHAIFKCLCDCGNYTEVYSQNIRSGHTSSCGCLSIQHKEDFSTKSITHGLSKHPLFVSWIGMRNRCYYKNHNRYKHYGAKGIIVCDEWKENFMAFYDWGITNGWQKGLSIDRKETDKNYCPDNCKFSTVAEQNRNRTSNVIITYNGETKIATDWAKLTGVNPQVLTKRLRSMWPIHEVIYGRPKI